MFSINGGLGVGDLQQSIEFVTLDAAECTPVDFLDG